ncbi:tagaturonate reductase [Pedobacter sp. UYEF25]
MRLTRKNLKNIDAQNVSLPSANIFELPEKVLQFGTGVLLRALPDYFIDKANQQGVFNGRVVVVKSTDYGSTRAFDDQDSLYTLCIKGIENGETKEQNVVCSAISRVLTANKEWEEILDVAASAHLEIIISNTTEVGIQLVEDDVNAHPPISFPGKLLAVLFHRYTKFEGAADKGLVIVPTELIVDNGAKLKDIVLKLANKNSLSNAFIKWVNEHNYFCNSLVDCIVPGRPDEELMKSAERDFGYEDDLLIVSEVYRLWAISGDEKIKQVLSFAFADKGVVVTPDINLYRELKLRLLNATHTLTCGLAYLAGFKTVKSAMDDTAMERYISNLMCSEIASAIPYKVQKNVTDEFACNVLDRFRNPHIQHLWLGITSNYSSKIKMRVIPVLLNYVKEFNTFPPLMAIGFAAYIRFMKPAKIVDNQYFGAHQQGSYLINDTEAKHLAAFYENNEGLVLIEKMLSDRSLWDEDLSKIPGFSKAINDFLVAMDNEKSIEKLLTDELAK